MTKVTVFYNRQRDAQGRPVGMLDSFAKGHAVEQVAQFDVDATPTPVYAGGADNGWVAVVEQAWRAMNRVDGSSVEQVPDGERSMCVGDVVVVDRWGTFAVADFGWTELMGATPAHWAPAI